MELRELAARVLPCPKQMELLQGKVLLFNERPRFSLQTENIGQPLVEMLGKYLQKHIDKDCLCFSKHAVPITVRLGEPDVPIENREEGYRLTVTGDGIKITGFGETGILYGMVSFCQLLRWQDGTAELPALEILDWPEMKMRGLFVESRYGTNVMEKEDWFRMLDEALDKKLNVMHIGIYGCWTVQYDGRVSEYLYVPVPGYPKLKTPMAVKYYSPEQGKWIDYEKLPPMYRDDFFGEVVRYGSQRGITVYPTWNSLGHNTLAPTQYPETSARDENGAPSFTGFCTSREETYELLFAAYDHIIDNYLKPSGVTAFCIGMDEVMDGVGQHAQDVLKRRSPWCKCPQCQSRDKDDIFVEHILRQLRHLVSKGIDTVVIYGDELRGKHENRDTVGCGQKLAAALEREGLKDKLLVTWWSYTDIASKLDFHDLCPELGLRSVVTPMTGYYHWTILSHPLRNIQMLAEVGHREKAEGIDAYSSWDKSYDRAYDAVAEYGWDYEKAGTPENITRRYCLRNFPSMADACERALRMMELITQVRIKNVEDPDSAVVSNFFVMRHLLSYYDFSYVAADKPYPRNFPAEPLELLLDRRRIYDRVLLENAAMAKQAMEIFTAAAETPGCDRELAKRYAYECHNYMCAAEDYMALLRMYDLSLEDADQKIAQLAHARHEARLALMADCEQAKELYIREALTMRNHSIYLQMFADIEAAARQNKKLDMLNLQDIFSDRFWSLR